jgi:hypothetical protein
MKSVRENNLPVLLISAVVGAVVGLGAGFVLIKRAETRGRSQAISAGEGLSIGLLVLGLLRQIGQLGEGDE